jgi:hypothetical protein
MFQKKRFFENKKNQSEIFNCGLSCQACQAKQKKVALKKYFRLHNSGTTAGAALRVKFFFFFFFFFKIPDLAHRPTSAPIVAENRR